MSAAADESAFDLDRDLADLENPRGPLSTPDHDVASGPPIPSAPSQPGAPPHQTALQHQGPAASGSTPHSLAVPPGVHANAAGTASHSGDRANGSPHDLAAIDRQPQSKPLPRPPLARQSNTTQLLPLPANEAAPEGDSRPLPQQGDGLQSSPQVPTAPAAGPTTTLHTSTQQRRSNPGQKATTVTAAPKHPPAANYIASATPGGGLGASGVTCPYCTANVLPVVRIKTSRNGWVLCTVIFLLGFIFPILWCGCCLIPLWMAKDRHRSCPRCQKSLDTVAKVKK